MMINYERLHQAIIDAENDGDWRVGLLSQQTLAEKFSSQNNGSAGTKTQVSEPPTAKKVINAATPWVTLLHLAARESKAQNSTSTRQSFGTKNRISFESPLLEAAHRKTVNSLTARTGFPRNDVEQVLAQRWSGERAWSRSVEAGIRWMRDVPESWFAECGDCGEDNEMPWENCSHCGSARDG